MDPLTPRLRPDPRNIGQQLRERITQEIESISPELRCHAAQPTAARAQAINPLLLAHRTLCRTSGAIPVFLGVPTSATGASWRLFRIGQRGCGLYCAGTAITMPTAMALATAGFSQSPRLVLFQRASTVTGFAWLTPSPHQPSGTHPPARIARPPVT